MTVALGAEATGRWLMLAVVAAAAALGVLVGYSPALGLAVAFAIGFALLMLSDLALGVVAFTVVSFIDVIEIGGPVVSGVKVVGLVLVLSWLAATARGTRPDLFRDHPWLVAVGVTFLAWGLLSAVWAASPGDALAGTGRYALNLCLFPIVYSAVRTRAHVKWILTAFVAGALASVAYELVFGGPASADSDRLAGAVGEANETATVLVAAILLAVGLLGTLRRSPALQLAALTGAGLALAGLFDTLSRAGLLALGVALLVGVVAGGRWRGQIALVGGVLAVGALAYFVALAPEASRDRVRSRDSSGRATIWQVAWRVVEAHPIVGVGADNFRVSAVHYLVRPGATTRSDYIVSRPKVAHNIYLETWANLGAVGLGMLLAILGLALRCAFVAARRFEDSDVGLELISRAVGLAVVAVLAADFFASAQYSQQLWLLLALCPALHALSQRPEHLTA